MLKKQTFVRNNQHEDAACPMEEALSVPVNNKLTRKSSWRARQVRTASWHHHHRGGQNQSKKSKLLFHNAGSPDDLDVGGMDPMMSTLCSHCLVPRSDSDHILSSTLVLDFTAMRLEMTCASIMPSCLVSAISMSCLLWGVSMLDQCDCSIEPLLTHVRP